jgi:hypothetical protein
MVAVQAVQERHLVPGCAQHAGHSQKPQRLDPLAKGDKIHNPRIDAEDSCHQRLL